MQEEHRGGEGSRETDVMSVVLGMKNVSCFSCAPILGPSL